MRYCSRCVLPDTRPGITLGTDGVCSACEGHGAKDGQIDWAARRAELESLFEQARGLERGYDCIVPVSGGKDSTWQVVTCLEHGLNVLAVTWRTPGRTALGQSNLDNLIGLGVDHIDYTINPDVERRFMLKTLERTGSTAVPMHMALYAIPLRIATSFGVPLVVWGESPHMEYGGTEEQRKFNTLDHEWFKHHGILQGTTPEDWIDEELTAKNLEPYFLPSREAFAAAQVRSVFLGYYLPWDPVESLRVARANGFRTREAGPRVGYYDYADIDCDFISVHHHFKWVKFGFTRLFDNLSIEIRNGRMTRDEAVAQIASRGDQTPHEDIAKLCEFLEISRARFSEIEESFRNTDIWTRRNGAWQIDGFIVPDWEWS